MTYSLGEALLIVGGGIGGVSVLLMCLAHLDPNTRRRSMLSKIFSRRRQPAGSEAGLSAVIGGPSPVPPAAPAEP